MSFLGALSWRTQNGALTNMAQQAVEQYHWLRPEEMLVWAGVPGQLAVAGRSPAADTGRKPIVSLHPATPTPDPLTASMRDYRHVDELATLLSPRVRAALAETNAIRCGYADLWIQRRP